MGANPWDKFFWNDWETDPELKLCSFAAQGLWMRILCICAKADPKGYLVAAGRPLSPSDLASLVGKPVPEVETLLVELSNHGVYSADRKGRIYSRRMVRAVKISRTAVENGKKGGNPNLSKQTVIPASDNLPDKPPDKPHKPEPLPKLEAAAAARDVGAGQDREIARLNQILGFSDGDFSKLLANLRTLHDLKEAGCDFETHILPAAQESVGRGAKTLKYIRPRALELRDAGRVASSIQSMFVPTDEFGWLERVRAWREKGLWSPKFGPAPGEEGCVCPEYILNQRIAS